MKTIKLYAAIVLAAVALSSCNEDYGDAKMHTTINSDGTCSRSIDFKTESIDLKTEYEVIPSGIDPAASTSALIGLPPPTTTPQESLTSATSTTWSRCRRLCRLNSTRNRSPRRQLLKSVSVGSTPNTRSQRCLQQSAAIFPCPLPTTPTPKTTNYADAEEVNYWFTGQPNLINGMNGAEAMERLSDLESKMNNWFSDNVINSGLDYIYTHYDSIAEPPVSREQFAQLHDSLATFIRNQSGKDILSYDSKKGFQEFFKSDAYSIFFSGSSYCAQGFRDHLVPVVRPGIQRPSCTRCQFLIFICAIRTYNARQSHRPRQWHLLRRRNHLPPLRRPSHPRRLRHHRHISTDKHLGVCGNNRHNSFSDRQLGVAEEIIDHSPHLAHTLHLRLYDTERGSVGGKYRVQSLCLLSRIVGIRVAHLPLLVQRLGKTTPAPRG